jgi:serine/threonine protein kinase
LRRRTAAAPAWTPEDDEELAALRLKAAARAAPDAIRRKAPQELATTVTPDGSFNTQDEADTPHSSIEDFALERSIGKGAFGEVFLATSKLTGRTYAVKTIPRSKAGDERRALLAVRHPFVIKLRWVLYDATDAWLVMDYAPRGTLASHLERRPGRRLPIAHARLVSAELASALLALHAAGVVHRDVKPSNILVDGAGHCLLADLGLAATRASMRLCGTLEYLAPEQLRGKTYGRSVDLWALGCLTFECLVGYSPFSAARTRAVFEGILRHEPYYVACGDSDAIDLVQGLLRKDVQSRFGISEDLLAHAYFADVDRSLLYQRRLPPPLGEEDIVPPVASVGSVPWPTMSSSRNSSIRAETPLQREASPVVEAVRKTHHKRQNPLDRARHDPASKPRGPPLPPRPVEEQPALLAAAALTEAPSRERPVVDAALFVSTDELRLWADSDEENGPPVYRRRSGTLFRHEQLLTPEAPRRRRPPRHTV